MTITPTYTRAVSSSSAVSSRVAEGHDFVTHDVRPGLLTKRQGIYGSNRTIPTYFSFEVVNFNRNRCTVVSYLTTQLVTVRGRGINFGHEPLVENRSTRWKPCSIYIFTWHLEKDYSVIPFR